MNTYHIPNNVKNVNIIGKHVEESGPLVFGEPQLSNILFLWPYTILGISVAAASQPVHLSMETFKCNTGFETMKKVELD